MSMPTRRQTAAVAWTAGDDRLRLLLDGMADHAVVMLGPQGMVLTWNAGACRILGYLAEEIIGQHFSTFYCEETLPSGTPQANLDEALRTGRFEEEGWRVRKDGTRFWASVVLTPLRDRSGRLRGFGQVTRDLSDRLRAQDLLAILDAVTEAILGIDDSGRIIFANASAVQLFGYPQPDLVGRDVELLLPCGDQHERWLADVATAGSAQTRLRTADGSMWHGVRCDGGTFPADVRLASVETPRGRVVTATVRDRTDELASEEANRAFGEYLLELLRRGTGVDDEGGHTSGAIEAFATVLAATSEQVIIGTDVDARITFVNRGAEQLLGYEAEELLGASAPDLYDPDEWATLAAELGLPRDVDPLPELLRRGDGAAPRRWAYLTKHGERRPVWLTVAAVGDLRKPVGYVRVATEAGSTRERAPRVARQRTPGPLGDAPGGGTQSAPPPSGGARVGSTSA